jgi:WD40 repeat protein/serine/threonine protein kinase
MGTQPNRAAAIFDAAVELATAAERAAYLDAACGEDAQLRAEVEGLLAHDNAAGSFLDLSARPDSPSAVEEPVVTERPGTIIGPYKLMEQVGEGGMGLVFVAEQQRPVRRKVALKVIKPGMDTRQVVARFEAERQALALMDHPNIAKVHDGGETAGGRPYFVMELVKGVPITDYCDENRRTPRGRLELFLDVCHAVQHAHQKGIIHRDIKPSNVLIASHDGVPVVKIIDFGVAKAVGQHLTERTLYTQFTQLIGTPLYMSPEQAGQSALDVDTRSDIYSLGVLLYQLLTGTTPFDKERLSQASYEEIRRIIREEEPPKPSTRISTVGQAATTLSTQRKSNPKQLSRLFRGELDWIVMKALEKDRNRRYQTASAFAADVQRYLHDELVEARPPSALYRFRKLVRRHKRGFAMASFAAAALVAGVAALAVSNVRIGREKQQKEEALQEKEKVLERERLNSYYQRIALAEQEWSANNLLRMQQLLDDCPEDLRGWEWHYLRRLRYRNLPPLRHEAGVTDAAFSRDGRQVASVDRDGVVKVWDIQTRREVLRIQAHDKPASCMAFSPDGHYLATGSQDRTIKIWDVDTRQSIRILQGHKEPITSVAFSPDGRRLASASGGGADALDRTVKVWDVATGQALLTLEGHLEQVTKVVFSPDGRRLASASRDQTVKLWDSETGQELRTFRGHTLGVTGVAFSTDGQRLASAAGDWSKRGRGEAKVWDVQTGEEVLNLRGHTTLVLGVAFSPDGRRLATSGVDKNVKLWDATNGREILTLRGPRLYGNNPRVAFSPDGTRLLCAGRDHMVRVWDATPLGDAVGEEVLTLRHDGGVRSVAFCPDGKCLASAGEDEMVRIWQLPSGRELHGLHGQSGMMVHLAFSRQGKYLALGAKQLTVWDTTTWKEVWTRPTGSDAVAFGHDERLLASGSPNPNPLVRVWDVATGQERHTLRDHNWGILGLAFSPDGRTLASASADSSVRLWDVGTGAPIKTPPMRHDGPSRGVGFSPDGLYLASPGMEQTVKIWDTATWREWRTLHDPTNGILSVAWSPDGRRLAWGGTDATVKIGDPASGKILRTLRGHTAWVEGVAFSPDGQWIASASLDETVKLWPTRTPPESEDPDQ